MSYRTPVKNSSPLANYSFTTPSSSSSANDTFVQKRGSVETPMLNKSRSLNKELLQIAAMNNVSTPIKLPSTPQISRNLPSKLKPMVESPFKLKPVQNAPVVSTQIEPQPVRKNLFSQQPGQFRNITPTEATLSLVNTKNTSFEPHSDDNVLILMSRLQNKEFSMRKFISSLLLLLSLKLVNSLVNYLYFNTSWLDYLHDNFYNEFGVKIANHFVIFLISLNLLTSGVKLVQKQDQCLDLNLTNEQRQLLGLQLVVEENDEPTTEQTPVKQIIKEQKEIDTIGGANELLSNLNLSTPLDKLKLN